MHHRPESFHQRAHFCQRLPFDLLGHHRRGGLTYRTPPALKPHGGDFPIGESDVDAELIAAQGVRPLDFDVRIGEGPLVARMRVVVEDHFAVQVVECHGSWAAPSFTFDAPASVWGKTACGRHANPAPARRCLVRYCTGTHSPDSSPTRPAVGATAACSG